MTVKSRLMLLIGTAAAGMVMLVALHATLISAAVGLLLALTGLRTIRRLSSVAGGEVIRTGRSSEAIQEV